ncbi:MAG: hypothetical protein MAG451_02276 [Anaerolineales bacterium]|nr:hypothetical protein [Anaerolineales bacterium]
MPRAPHRQEGQSLVELALLLPVLMLIFAGVLDLGRAFQAYITVANAAREGARYAAFHMNDCTDIELKPNLRSRVANEAAGSNIDLSTAATIVRLEPPCSPENYSPGDPVSVIVEHSFQLITGLIFGSDTIMISASAAMAQF